MSVLAGDAGLRRNDYSLSEDQQAISGTFEAFFRDRCPTARVRAAEPLGFDELLWREFLRLGALSFARSQPADEPKVTLLDLALIVEQYGRHLAPLPLIEAIVSARLLSGFDAAMARDWADQIASGASVVTVALQPSVPGRLHLVPAGAIAGAAILFESGQLVIVSQNDGWPLVTNQASSPLAWIRNQASDLNRTVVGSGEKASRLYAAAVLEWKLLTAASLSGLGNGVVDLAVDYAKNRHAFGVPIGTFQAVSHALVDAAIGVEGSRNLTRKAAWFADHDHELASGMVAAAYLYAVESATIAATVGVHVQGGFGFTLESDAQLYFRRSKGWPVIAGDPRLELSKVADELTAPHST